MTAGGPAALQSGQNGHNSTFCSHLNSESHTINRCTTFHHLEHSAKMDILKRNHIRFHCIGKVHNLKDCLETITCYMKLFQSIMGHTPGDALPRQPYGATPGGHASRVSMQAPFPYRVTPSRRHRLATEKSSVGVPLAFSKSGYP